VLTHEDVTSLINTKIWKNVPKRTQPDTATWPLRDANKSH